MAQLPNWVGKDPGKFLPRLKQEVDLLNAAFPFFKVLMAGDVMYAEGVIVTINQNAYKVRLYYPEDFPYSAPDAVVMDRDVKAYCLSQGMHSAHHRGERDGGVTLCVLKPDDRVGTGWEPKKGGYFILNIAAAWIHAHEVQIRSGRWILPEAN